VLLVGFGVCVAVGAQFTAGGAGLLVSAPVWAGAAAVALLPAAGRPLGVWVPLVTDWGVRRALRRTRHRARPVDPAPGQLLLPTAGHWLLRSVPEVGAVLLVDRRRGEQVAACTVHGPGLLLADDDTHEQLVGGWGRLLAGLCQQRDVLRVQLLTGRHHGGMSAARGWWADHGVPGAPWLTLLVRDLLAEHDHQPGRCDTVLVVVLRPPGRKRGHPDAAACRLEAITAAVRATDLSPGPWWRTSQWQQALDDGYDDRPARPETTQAAGLDVGLVGPMGMHEGWDRLRTDSGWHAVFWVRQWPRLEVPAGFLQPLLAPGVRRSLSLLVEPIPTGRALREVRRARVEHAADAAHRARSGRIEDESERAEHEDVLRRERELVAGHGDLRFTGLLTVTADTSDGLDQACAATETAAAQAMLELRRLVGQQALAHTAALPLGRPLW
jgi:hypothetical protein